jgi:glycolate oxidase FAD binding subunit
MISSDVVDYPARDMTITVGAGMSVGTLQTLLAKENQQLPIDVADDAITLGQIVADDISGPRQFGYGTLRDYVIGIEAVDGAGRIFHAGGRVVKNVAGYDLCRLLVGSRGQLGTITQLTFKLKPLPTYQSLVIAGFRSFRDLDAALERLNLTATTPIILDVISRHASLRLLETAVPDLAGTTRCSDAASLLVIGFEGPPQACDWQHSILKDELKPTAAWTHLSESADAFTRYCQAAQRAALPTPDDAWMARLATLPSRVVSAMTVLQDAGCDVFGRAGNGILHVRPPVNSSMEKRAVEESVGLGHLQSLVSDGIGSVAVLKSVQGKSTVSSHEVQAISRRLRELLGKPETVMPVPG